MDQLVMQPDAAIIARVQSGETDCFDELVRRYQLALMRMARSRLGRDDWAEEVVQETFLAAFKSCNSYDPHYSFRTWLWTILLNQCHTHFGRRTRQSPCAPLSPDCEPPARGNTAEGDSPLVALLAKERSAQLESLLAQLRPVQADALRLRFFGGLKFHEIAEAMHSSLNTAKNRVRIGLMRMAELLAAADTCRTTSDNPRGSFEE
ncbi:MAG TPA: RNA polymerase sigma factor [Pirellulales bacterium]|nr:RNA polymerase sigma factor [Pirellulales bacterium]